MSQNQTPAEGRCLCGSVKVTAPSLSEHLGACHCNMCRRHGGGPLLAVDAGQDVKFEGKENIQTYDSSAWAERGFCKKCGTHLFYRLKEMNNYTLTAGLFEKSFAFTHQIFIDEKPTYYDFSNKTETMTGPEVFAKYAKSPE